MNVINFYDLAKQCDTIYIFIRFVEKFFNDIATVLLFGFA